jgi:hypothetical protein
LASKNLVESNPSFEYVLATTVFYIRWMIRIVQCWLLGSGIAAKSIGNPPLYLAPSLSGAPLRAGLSLDAFKADRRTFYAVTRYLEIISEAARRLPRYVTGIPTCPGAQSWASASCTG